jgi:hypothetical protein
MPVELVERSKIGVKAALARFDLKEERACEAAETYAGLLADTDHFPEAVNGLDRAIKQLGQLALDQLSRRYTQALKLLDNIRIFARLSQEPAGDQNSNRIAYLNMVDEREDARDWPFRTQSTYQAYRTRR